MNLDASNSELVKNSPKFQAGWSKKKQNSVVETVEPRNPRCPTSSWGVHQPFAGLIQKGHLHGSKWGENWVKVPEKWGKEMKSYHCLRKMIGYFTDFPVVSDEKVPFVWEHHRENGPKSTVYLLGFADVGPPGKLEKTPRVFLPIPQMMDQPMRNWNWNVRDRLVVRVSKKVGMFTYWFTMCMCVYIYIHIMIWYISWYDTYISLYTYVYISWYIHNMICIYNYICYTIVYTMMIKTPVLRRTSKYQGPGAVIPTTFAMDFLTIEKWKIHGTSFI